MQGVLLHTHFLAPSFVKDQVLTEKFKLAHRHSDGFRRPCCSAFRSNLFFQGQGENCPKEERWRSQIESARVFLERSSTLLLISSKTFQRHQQCPNARENRDTVFCQMRRALDLIHYIIKVNYTYIVCIYRVSRFLLVFLRKHARK